MCLTDAAVGVGVAGGHPGAARSTQPAPAFGRRSVSVVARRPRQVQAGGPSAGHEDAGVEGDLPAGDFSTWLAEFAAALDGKRAADVPCGGCTACCESSQFIHIAPDETDAL